MVIMVGWLPSFPPNLTIKMKTLITQSQGSRNQSHNRQTEIPQAFLEQFCYNMNDDATVLTHCKYMHSRDCPKECELYEKRHEAYRSGIERLTNKYPEWGR